MWVFIVLVLLYVLLGQEWGEMATGGRKFLGGIQSGDSPRGKRRKRDRNTENTENTENTDHTTSGVVTEYRELGLDGEKEAAGGWGY